MKIAVLASHTFLSQSGTWSGWQQAQRTGGVEWCARTCQTFSPVRPDLRHMGAELSQNPTVRAKHRWKAAGVPTTRRKTAGSTWQKGNGQCKGKGTSTTGENSPAKFEG